MKILMIDNYDSFTYNLVHMLEAFPGVEVRVCRNDEITIAEVDEYSEIILSPGPGVPADAGIMQELVRRYAPSKRILGVCLGHQCIGEVFGAQLQNLSSPVHGKARGVTVCDPDEIMFRGLPRDLTVGRYHSWVIQRDSLPQALEITARDAEGEIMAIRHREFDVRGVQFHPESILTPEGGKMLKNWICHDTVAS